MTIYVDASVVFSIVTIAVHSQRARRWIDTHPKMAATLWSIAEVTSAFAIKVRSGELTVNDRQSAELKLDEWLRRLGEPIDVLASDYAACRRLINTLDLPLRAPDALHLAVAQRSCSALATFDKGLADAAQAIGVPVVDL